MIKAFKEVIGSANVLIEADAALSMMESGRIEEIVNSNDAQHAYLRGDVSGFILGYTIFGNQSATGNKFVSRADAYTMVREAFVSIGQKRGWGEENVSRYIWGKYEGVAHLWASMRIMLDRGSDIAALCTDEGFFQFLLIAEWLRNAGERLRPGNAPVSVLDHLKTLRIRPEVSAEWPNIHVESGNLSDWDLRVRFQSCALR
jgi:hypothetical protein